VGVRDRVPRRFGLAAAELISSAGTTQTTWLAVPWFVLQTGSATGMGVVSAVEVVPTIVLGIPSGSIVQRFGRAARCWCATWLVVHYWPSCRERRSGRVGDAPSWLLFGGDRP
jgi:hypothetical protein